jgi:hypothetical protein
LRAVLVVLLLAGCGAGEGADTGAPPATGATEEPGPADWCAVQSVFRSRCNLCHSPGNLQGDLDLVTDAFAAVVGVESLAFGALLVAPGDPDGSLLYRKMAGTQGSDEGEPMPPAGTVASAADTVGRWITDGATEICDER